jgi:hypothetical protein
MLCSYCSRGDLARTRTCVQVPVTSERDVFDRLGVVYLAPHERSFEAKHALQLLPDAVADKHKGVPRYTAAVLQRSPTLSTQAHTRAAAPPVAPFDDADCAPPLTP